MGVVPRIPDGMYLLGVRVRYTRVGCTLKISRVNVTRKPQILILTQSTPPYCKPTSSGELPKYPPGTLSFSRQFANVTASQ